MQALVVSVERAAVVSHVGGGRGEESALEVFHQWAEGEDQLTYNIACTDPLIIDPRLDADEAEKWRVQMRGGYVAGGGEGGAGADEDLVMDPKELAKYGGVDEAEAQRNGGAGAGAGAGEYV